MLPLLRIGVKKLPWTDPNSQFVQAPRNTWGFDRISAMGLLLKKFGKYLFPEDKICGERLKLILRGMEFLGEVVSLRNSKSYKAIKCLRSEFGKFRQMASADSIPDGFSPLPHSNGDDCIASLQHTTFPAGISSSDPHILPHNLAAPCHH